MTLNNNLNKANLMNICNQHLLGKQGNTYDSTQSYEKTNRLELLSIPLLFLKYVSYINY